MSALEMPVSPASPADREEVVSAAVGEDLRPTDTGADLGAEAEPPVSPMSDEEFFTKFADEFRLSEEMTSSGIRSLFFEFFVTDITTLVDAVVKVPTFLSEYLIKVFQYRDFVKDVGLAPDECLDDPDMWEQYVDDNLINDYTQAVEMMSNFIEFAAKAVSKVEGMDGWFESSSAVEEVRKCVRLSKTQVPKSVYLSHRLVGPLNKAKALRYTFPRKDTPNTFVLNNPFQEDPEKAAQSQEIFAYIHGVEWDAISAKIPEAELESRCSGRMQVVSISMSSNLVTFIASRVDETDDGDEQIDEWLETIPYKAPVKGERVQVEFDSKIVKNFEIGMLLNADWFKLSDNSWFCDFPGLVWPSWVQEVLETRLPEEDAEEEPKSPVL